MKQSRIDFIKAAHSEACSAWKEKIEKEFPKIFKEEFKVGDWIAKEWNDGDLDLFKLSRIKGKKLYNELGFYFRNGANLESDNNKACDSIYDPRIKLRKATPEEIEKHLIKEAKRRGLWNVPIVGIESMKCHTESFVVVYDIGKDELWSRYGIVYGKGRFAEKLETLDGTTREIEGKTYKLTLV